MAQMTRGSGERTFAAGADLSAKQYYIVKQDSTQNQVVLAAAATDPIVGVLLNAPASGKEARVAMSEGTVKVVAGGNIALGDLVTSDGNGKAVATTTNKDWVIGRALEAATDGKVFEVMLAQGKMSF